MAQLKRPTIKNPELVSAIAEFKTQPNKQTEEAMLDAIQQASFIAPIALQESLADAKPDENGKRQVQASLLAVSNKKGEKLFPAFTDWLEFLKWKNDPEAETMVITFDQYCDILLKQGGNIRGIVVNPSETNIVLPREKMAELKGIELPKIETSQSIVPMFGAEKIKNPAVVEAAVRFRSESNAETQRAFFDALRKARFVAPARMKNMPKNVKPGDKVTAQAEFIMITHESKKYLPIFTELSELQRWTAAPPCSAVPLTLENYTAMLSDQKNTAAGIVVNPFSLGLAFEKNQVLAIQPRLTLQELKVIPMDILNELKSHFETLPTVKAAYLNGIKANDNDGYIIVVDLEGKKDVREIGDAVSEILKKHQIPCVVAPADSPLGKKAMEGKAAFYTA